MAKYRISYHPNSSNPSDEIESVGYKTEGPWLAFYSEPGHVSFRVKTDAVLKVVEIER